MNIEEARKIAKILPDISDGDDDYACRVFTAAFPFRWEAVYTGKGYYVRVHAGPLKHPPARSWGFYFKEPVQEGTGAASHLNFWARTYLGAKRKAMKHAREKGWTFMTPTWNHDPVGTAKLRGLLVSPA